MTPDFNLNLPSLRIFANAELPRSGPVGGTLHACIHYFISNLDTKKEIYL